jgi:type VI secretion system protein VasG
MVDLKSLLGKLNSTCRQALEKAAARCVAATHYNVELEHFLLELVEAKAPDLLSILRYYGVETSDVERQLRRALDGFERGNGRTPAFAPGLVELLRSAWLTSSLRLQAPAIRSGALIFALTGEDDLRRQILENCPALVRINGATLEQDFTDLLRASGDESLSPTRPVEDAAAPAGEPAAPSATPSLDRYTLDLTADARAGKVDPIRGRDREIRQVVDILTRRRQNNPILVGEAGVGKTAVVEGFAQRVAGGSVPASLREVSVRVLDLALLQAGAGVQGEFEERLKTVIAEVESSPRPIILFIDEAHTLIGAGGAAGRGDAANLLKPALARGQLRTIAATTWSEYKKYFEKDPALARRFQPVKVEEPDEEAAIDMLRGLAPKLESHHGVRVLDEAVRDAVLLSARYLSDRKLPDKAIGVLDTACARVALAQAGLPGELEDLDRRIDRAELEFDVLMRELVDRETAEGKRRALAADRLADELAQLQHKRHQLEQRWRRENEMVREILELRAELERIRQHGEDNDTLAQRLAQLELACRTFQGERPMVPVAVDGAAVAAVISSWTGVPAGRMLRDDIHGLLDLAGRLGERVVGQVQAIDTICRRIRTAGAGLEDPGKPKGVFLLVGPTGVGKTETAIAIAELLYGGVQNLVTVNMSELQEAHSVATLRGSPPGYVGYGQGGVLTEAVRRRPHCVVLLDEIEKAHRDVVELFYQVFDKGILEDGEGVPVSFKHSVILMTSNVGAEQIVEAACRQAEGVESEELAEELRPILLRHFPAAFLGRTVLVPYLPLGLDEVREIVGLKLDKVRERVAAAHRAELLWDDSLVDEIAGRCAGGDSGGRTVDHLLTHTLLPELSGRLLERMAAGDATARIEMSWHPSRGWQLEVE